ncbi:uncharacterized protein LOC124265113 [Haliotis rubra]|uniref:uncharacterized protein LOC124265113 n=1 Tax=Haliotis rubra TaxID=36100 RepID=UPI001EE5691A|nr:uncharacterized protein LOC124265113 [Haliotis rubra]
MTSFKRSDWLRHLYLEGTKWEKAFPGKVPWHTLNVGKDPNNGSKLPVEDIEEHLPKMLSDCMDNSLVPHEYIPEVMAYITRKEKFETKNVSKFVQKRKMALNITDCIKRFLELPHCEKRRMKRKIESQDLCVILTGVEKLMTMTDTGRSPEYKAEECEEKSKAFKLIDWLRHIYLCCQKWLNDCEGQVPWVKLKVKDPNNSKKGLRMRMEELKEALTILAGQCLDFEVVPQLYMEEVMEARRVLEEDLGFDPKKLEKEEKLRKTVEALGFLKSKEDLSEEVIGTIDPAHLPLIQKGLQALEECLGVDRPVMEKEPGEEDQHNEMEEYKFPDQETLNMDEEDGTNILLDILDKQNPATLTQVASDEIDVLASEPVYAPEEDPGLVPSPCYVSDFSEASPIPPSPEKCMDGHMSDDSGIHSPMSSVQDNSDSEDDLADFLKHFLTGLEVDTEGIYIADLGLPDPPDLGIRCLKRKISDDLDEPVLKKKRP